jgi:hypothetical protein
LRHHKFTAEGNTIRGNTGSSVDFTHRLVN